MTIEQARKLIPEGSHREMEQLLGLDLNKESTVVMVGSYSGVTTHLIYEAYGCRIICYDPQTKMNEKLEKLVPSAEIHAFALGGKNGVFPFYQRNNTASSFFTLKSNEKTVDVEMRNAAEELEGLNIDLLFMNCEGSEYEILSALEQKDSLKNIQYMMIQFHKAYAKGNGAEYIQWRDKLREIFDVPWSLGAPWTLFVREESPIDPPEDLVEFVDGMPEQEPSLSNEVVEEHQCPDCDWTTTAKDYRRSIKRHKREEHN